MIKSGSIHSIHENIDLNCLLESTICINSSIIISASVCFYKNLLGLREKISITVEES